MLYRGFEGSPILGTPIGIAVYQNGVRLNEPFGDNINWDLIPNFAINSSSIIPTNPVYGLNALGGAFVIEMKNGFNFHGFQGDFAGGSFGQNQATLQYGQQAGNVGIYMGGNLFNDGRLSQTLSPSHVRQLDGDIGAESEHGSLHLSFTGANNTLSGIGPTPIQLADIDRAAVFTSPQSFQNTLLMPALNRALALTNVDGVPVHVGENLNLHVPGVFHKFFNVDGVVAESGHRFRTCVPKRAG